MKGILIFIFVAFIFIGCDGSFYGGEEKDRETIDMSNQNNQSNNENNSNTNNNSDNNNTSNNNNDNNSNSNSNSNSNKPKMEFYKFWHSKANKKAMGPWPMIIGYHNNTRTMYLTQYTPGTDTEYHTTEIDTYAYDIKNYRFHSGNKIVVTGNINDEFPFIYKDGEIKEIELGLEEHKYLDVCDISIIDDKLTVVGSLINLNDVSKFFYKSDNVITYFDVYKIDNQEPNDVIAVFYEEFILKNNNMYLFGEYIVQLPDSPAQEKGYVYWENNDENYTFISTYDSYVNKKAELTQDATYINGCYFGIQNNDHTQYATETTIDGQIIKVDYTKDVNGKIYTVGLCDDVPCYAVGDEVTVIEFDHDDEGQFLVSYKILIKN